MKKVLVSASALFVLMAQSFCTFAKDTMLVTHSGPIVGAVKDNISVYKGIPYAKPPIGNLRFAPPEDVSPWKEPLNCKNFGPSFMQENNKESSEDGLTLNVWTPGKSGENNKLPVYVFIHGGAFVVGSGAAPTYDGTNFAKDGVVTVTINYRLGALGFYASQTTYDEYGTTGNWGLLDQVKALEWVNKNIETFGGDPNNVTIGGESAGSYSVSALLLNPHAKGLFQKAIMESGDILSIPANNYYAQGDLKRSIEVSNMLGQVFGANDNKEGLKKLRETDAQAITYLSVTDLNFTKVPAFFILPVYDDYAIPKNPVEALYTKKFNNVKLLFGYNADEGSMFIPEGLNEGQYKMYIYKTFGSDNVKAVMERYPIDKNHSATQRTRQLLKYAMFVSGMKSFGDMYSQNGTDVWAYNYNYVSNNDAEKGFGAAHGSEVQYIFGNFSSNPSWADKKLSREMHTRWVNFIKNGDPNIGIPVRTKWQKYDSENTRIMKFNTTVEDSVMSEKDDLEFMQKIIFKK